MEIALIWSGEAGDPVRHMPGIPARDLTADDVARLTYLRTIGTRVEGYAGLYPGDDGFDAAAALVVSELIGTGLYTSPNRPARPARKE